MYPTIRAHTDCKGIIMTNAPIHHVGDLILMQKCAYHMDAVGHDARNCWALKHETKTILHVSPIRYDPPTPIHKSSSEIIF